ncbi:MAG: hypothetical protein FWG15_06895 [Propionibacteriaceae bacterium]|nr:hypothetical protein [Propionibacteriaceae bacterium]
MSRRFSFVLPEMWWRIPLQNEQARTAGIDRLIDHHFAQRDDLAQVRHETRQELLAQAEKAAQFSGLMQGFFLAGTEEHSVAATMTCYDMSGMTSLPADLDWAKILQGYVDPAQKDLAVSAIEESYITEEQREAFQQEAETSPEDEDSTSKEYPDAFFEGLASLEADYADRPDVLKMLEDLRDQETPSPESDWEHVDIESMIAYRRDSVEEGTDHFGEEAKVPTLHVQYMQVVPDFGLVQTTFSTAYYAMRDDWVRMFDALISTYRNASTPSTSTSQENTDES